MFHPKTYNERRIKLELTNLAVGNHCLVCDCNKPTFHTAKILLQQLSPELSPEEKKQLKECLSIDGGTTSKTVGTNTGIEEDDFGEELEKLFQEDTADAAG